MTTIAYWTSGLIYLLIDYTQFPKFLMKYKVQPGKNEPPDTKKVLKALALVLFNQVSIFHQNFTSGFFVQKFVMKLFSNYSLAL